ncbi:dipeptidyl aminopeptidase/acylaminoacyl peptidase [Acidovorax soli]|uniref:Dipeptidyl aminopeptidase/acylaminoacyl peptidase n=1 Tax=Acidovorax soli TaxID=592050 RepID=A0A7X0PKW4_9BURK|nr:S9 family peptidase [Acidovorax soli]MBB6563634.1 dipeptidyl aminopeptidase/acylaminoacyl peptidase [Acidovorax soli]
MHSYHHHDHPAPPRGHGTLTTLTATSRPRGRARLALAVAVAAAGLLALAGCATGPTHPSLAAAGAQLPALIPVRDFVTSLEGTGNYRISPDGTRLAWMGVSGLQPAVWVRTMGQTDARAYPIRARSLRWSADSRYLVATVDATGDENTHLHALAVDRPGAGWVDLTPFGKTLSALVQTVQGSPDLMVTSNRRDRKIFDLYRVDPRTGTHTVVATNPGNVSAWIVDRQGRLHARATLAGDQVTLQRPDAAAPGGWRDGMQWNRFDAVRLLEAADDGGEHMWALSARGRDKKALVRLRLADGAETVVHASDDVDLDHALISPRTQQPLVAYSLPGYPRREVFDARLRERLDALAGGEPAEVSITSMDDSEHTLTAVVATDRGQRSYLLPADGPPELLGESGLSLVRGTLARSRPIALTARDGLPLHGYLTLPEGVEPRNLPLVLLVHGGPWARDRWTVGPTSRSMQQFLANRGYAVLQINYRGSSGYGRAFMEKAIGEFAGRMHDDLVDGVRWAVQQGIADPARVAIQGASYGGYAALVGATFTPEVFACAIDVVGMSSLALLLEKAPPYWEMGIAGWHRYVGDPARPEDRRTMDAKSPLFKVGPETRPLLIMHGVNDVRVTLEQSERMVQALRQAGRPVQYVTFQGDGHGNQRWPNNLTMYRKTEDFLAQCLGGRSSGFDYYQLGAWAF